MSSRACADCGRCGCECSVLPYAAQVTFSGLTNQTRLSPCVVQFHSCFGAGVSAIITDPGGCPEQTAEYCSTFCPPSDTSTGIVYPNDSGPVEHVLLMSGGSNYACVGREDPTGKVFAAATPAGNAPPARIVLRPSQAAILENTDTSASVRMAKIFVVDDGRGENTITLGGPDAGWFELDELTGRTLLLRQGVSVNFEAKPYYQVTVSVRDEDVEDSEAVTATFTLVVVDSLDEPGDAKAVPGVASPPPAPAGTTQDGATEATFVPVFTRHVENPCYAPPSASCWPEDLELPERPYWSVESCEVTGGTFYEGEEPLTFTASRGVVQEEAAIGYVIVDEAGVPTGVKILHGGRYYLENRDPEASIVSPVIGCVRCAAAENVYYLPDGRSVTYPFALDSDTGARIVGVVEDDPVHPKFGQVVSLEVDEPGDHVLGWRWGRSCLSLLNGKPISVFGGGPGTVSFRLESCFGHGACITALPAPDRYEPDLRIYGEGSCHNVVSGNGPPPLYGCGGCIEYETERSFVDGDESQPVWSVTQVTATGGAHYENNALAYVFVHDPVTNRPDYRCPLEGRLPVIRLHAAGGVLTGATIVDGGEFYLERPYVGEPSPIKRLRLDSGGGTQKRVRRGEPLVTVYPRNNPGFGYRFIADLEEHGDVWTIKTVEFETLEDLQEWEFVPYIEGALVAGATLGTETDYAELWLFVDEFGQPKEVRVIDGGGFYYNVVDDEANGYAMLGRVAPTLSVTPTTTATGSGATVTLAVADSKDGCGRDFWYVQSADITGGTKYKDGQLLGVTVELGDTAAEPARLAVRAGRDGVPTAIDVVDAGKYWRESASVPAYVSDFVVRTLQLPPSNGSGVKLNITIDEDPDSETFGEVTKATIKSQGSGYILAGSAGCGYVAGECGVIVSLSPDASTVTLAQGAAGGRFSGGAVGPECGSWSQSLQAVSSANDGASVTITAPLQQISSCNGAPACYERCPDIRLLSMTVTFTTPLGVAVRTSADFLFAGAGGRIVGGSVEASFVVEGTNLFLTATLYVNCQDGELRLQAGWAGLAAENCFCTSVFGCSSKQCADGNWWEDDYLIVLQYDQTECPNCPEPGTVLVSISTPEEPLSGC